MWVKICGITSLEDAELALEAGADAIGLNFVPNSRRYITVEAARAITAALAQHVQIIGVVADLELEPARVLLQNSGVHTLQLHGNEAPSAVLELESRAFKVIHIAEPADVARAREYGGDPLLVDTKLGGQLGGTGRAFDWSLVRELAKERRIVLAGGLTPDNVAQAVELVAPFGVDVASGTERPGEPRRKVRDLVQRFVRAARVTRS